jgi:ribosomal protein S18 acetylase RimI-like enzyme
VIRPARVDDISVIIAIEIASGDLFRAIGMDSVADDPPSTRDELHEYIDEQLAVVATDESDFPIGYILFDVWPEFLFISQVTVDPRHARNGIGARLLDEGDRIAAERGRPGLALTTFRDVPWNAPYYQRLGFRIVDESDWSSTMVARMGAEAWRGLDVASRVVMLRP